MNTKPKETAVTGACTAKRITVIMASDEFGGEEFHYDTLIEAYRGIARLATKAAKLDDGIKRTFCIEA